MNAMQMGFQTADREAEMWEKGRRGISHDIKAAEFF